MTMLLMFKIMFGRIILMLDTHQDVLQLRIVLFYMQQNQKIIIFIKNKWLYHTKILKIKDLRGVLQLGIEAGCLTAGFILTLEKMFLKTRHVMLAKCPYLLFKC